MILKRNYIDNGAYDSGNPVFYESEYSEKIVNLLFTDFIDSSHSKRRNHEDILRLIYETELSAILNEYFNKLYVSDDSELSENSWVTLNRAFVANSKLIFEILRYYSRVFYSVGKKQDYSFLEYIFLNDKNTIYRLSAFIIIHILANKFLEEGVLVT